MKCLALLAMVFLLSPVRAAETIGDDSIPVSLLMACEVLDSSGTMEMISSLYTGIPMNAVAVISEEQIQPLRAREETDWHFYSLLCTVLLFAYVQAMYSKELKDVYQSFKNVQLSRQLFREQYASIPFSSLILLLMCVLVFGDYVFMITQGRKSGPGDFSLYLMVTAVTGALLLSKVISLKIAGFIFPFRQETEFYKFNFLLISQVGAIAFIPLIILLNYAPLYLFEITLQVSVLLFVGLYFFMLTRGFVIGREYLHLQKIHFFIYLCTFELAPIGIIYGSVQRWVLSS